MILVHDDLDGAGCAAVLLLAQPGELGGERNPEFVGYGDVDERVVQLATQCSKGHLGGPPEKLWVADITPSPAALRAALNLLGSSLFLWDHHITAKERLSWLNLKGYQVHCDTGHSATRGLAAHLGLLRDPHVQRFVEAVDAWDMWRLDAEARPEGELLNWAASTMDLGELAEQLMDAQKYGELLERGRWAQRIGEYRAAQFVRDHLYNPEYVDSQGYKFVRAMLNGEQVSLAAHQLLTELGDDVDYLLLYDPRGDRVHLRTQRDHVDVSQIAAARGGGGHVSAAGYALPLTRACYELDIRENEQE